MKTKILSKNFLMVLLLLLMITGQKVFGQKDSTDHKILKNTIRFNLTNPLIFGNSYILGYERVVRPNQTFSINIGTFSLPQLGSLNLESNYNLTSTKNESGYSFSGDYRFYLGSVNKYGAPRGVYIGPYVSNNKAKRNISLTSTDVGKFDVGYTFSALTLGFQLGYQFVFWDRVSLDMILMGPGISGYSLKTEVSTNLDPAKEAELFQKINEALAEKIPGYSRVIAPGSITKAGTFNTTSFGYRYLIMLGFRF
jgi:hypothetical protein